MKKMISIFYFLFNIKVFILNQNLYYTKISYFIKLKINIMIYIIFKNKNINFYYNFKLK